MRERGRERGRLGDNDRQRDEEEGREKDRMIERERMTESVAMLYKTVCFVISCVHRPCCLIIDICAAYLRENTLVLPCPTLYRFQADNRTIFMMLA